MTYPRAHLVDFVNGGYYHCHSRCVRRARLCGTDEVTGRNFEHRKKWIERRLHVLAEYFAVDLYAYAVMDNHYHIVVKTLPSLAATWSKREVARRWLASTPWTPPENIDEQIEILISHPERIEVLRKRLSSLSWFKGYINEPLARMSNREDDCTGRFWEGRFRSHALLDEAAIVNCMAYVDLNPCRAGLAVDAANAEHTGFRHRLQGALPVLASLGEIGLSLKSYHRLLDWTITSDRNSTIRADNKIIDMCRQFQQRPDDWLLSVRSHRLRLRAYGAVNSLQEYADQLGQHWVKQFRLP